MAYSKQQRGALPFFTGLALGSIITALLTPRSGSDMRGELKRKVGDMNTKRRNRNSTNYTNRTLSDELDLRHDAKIDEYDDLEITSVRRLNSEL
ncbi:MAG: hypothetical protein U0451_00950 [Candidatus Saccharimonadales bacterium]